MTLRLAPQYATLPHEEDLEAVRETAHRAAALGIATELLRVTSPRPLTRAARADPGAPTPGCWCSVPT